DGLGEDNRYEPLRGGRHGGALILETGAGDRFRIERYASSKSKLIGDVIVRDAGGNQFPDSHISRLLDSATEDLFNSVFAFGLHELQRLKTLTSDDVKGVIYSAGAGGIGTSLPKIYANLKKNMEGLFKKRGSSPEVNRLLKQIDEISKHLREIRAQSGRYDDLKREYDGSSASLTEQEARRKSLSASLSDVKTKLAAWDDWVGLQSARKRLDELPPVDRFPKDGIGRFEAMNGELRGANEAREAQRMQRAELQEELDAIVVNESLLANTEEIERLKQNRKEYESSVSDLPKVRASRNSKADDLKKNLAELGPNWDEAMLMRFDTSLATRDALLRLKGDIDKAENSRRIAGEKLTIAKEALQKAEDSEQAAKSQFERMPEPELKDEQEIRDRIKRLKEARKPCNSIRRAEDKLEDASARIKELESSAKREQERISWSASHPKLAALLISIVCMAVALVIYLAFDGPGIYAWPVVGLIFVGSYSTLYRRFEKMSRDFKTNLASLDSKKSGLLGMEMELRKALEANGSKLRDMLSFLQDKDIMPDERRLDDLMDDFRDMLIELEQWNRAFEAKERAAKEREAAKRSQSASSNALSERERDVEAAKSAWVSWLENAGLSASMSPNTAIVIPERVGACRGVLQSIRDLDERISKMEEVGERHKGQVLFVASACGIDSSGDVDPGRMLDALSRALHDAIEASARRERLKDEIDRLSREIETAKASIGGREKEIGKLFEAGGASNEEEFRERAGIYEERLDLLQQIKGGESALQRLVGPQRVQQLESSLAVADPIDLKERESELNDTLEGLETQLKELREERGGLKAQFEQLEQDEESSVLRLRKQELVAELKNAVKRWGAFSIARRVLQEAQAIYERDRQPNVIREASRLFKSMTRAKFSTIVKPMDSQSFEVRDEQGRTLQVGQLSQGTREQLLLAIRLGLVRDFGERQEKLPLVMDDVLVNFDYHRACATGEALHSLSETHQVLLFTCHQETLDLMLDVAPGAQIIKLSDGKIF
ncbi:AAA family ATPase, partial [bacterium]|nr:AAA family ATPase [bacterium]